MMIHGKSYVTVNSRIEYFRKRYETGRILTEITKQADGKVIFKASIYVGDNLVATGHAMEDETASQINKTSYIENCETSAIGRALGIMGIGIEGSVATYEEVNQAVSQQEDMKQAAPDTDTSNMSEIPNQKKVEPTAVIKDNPLDPERWKVPFKGSKNFGKTLNEMDIEDILKMKDWLIANYDPSGDFAEKNMALIDMLESYLAANGIDEDEIPM